MSSLVNLKEKLDFVAFPSGASVQKILDAESSLSLKFSNDYKEYTKKFGAASFDGHELTGVVESKRLSVVENTIRKRKIDKNLPLDFYVIEDLGIDGLTILQNETGHIYLYSSGNNMKKIANSLMEYFDNFE